MAVSEAALRRTQPERTAFMRSRLLDATVECLLERGYSGTSTTEVVRRAGVSRGAQVHHFPSKQDLVLAAMEHVLDRRQEEFRASFEGNDQRTLAAAIDLLWALYCGPTFAAWLELSVAARTDNELRPRYLELQRRFNEKTAEIFVQLFPEAPDTPFSRQGIEFAFAVLDGAALQRHLGIDADADEMIEILKFLATMFSADIGGTP